MHYLSIAGSIASLAALAGYLRDQFGKTDTADRASWLLGIFAFLTVCFWLWFYFAPRNPVRQAIRERLDYSGAYTDGTQAIDVVEGDLAVDMQGWGTSINLPPFERPPEVTLTRAGKRGGHNAPQVESTADAFTVRITSSTQAGTWRWRARGKLLRPMPPSQG